MSSRSTIIKRILKEANELASQPSDDYHAAPLESDMFEWHFTLRGPPAPSPFAGGLYHGRIVLPPAYPLKPPSFRFLTPTGRFEVNREICLSISGHHEETWQPAWGIRTALVALRSFMDTDPRGQLGGLDASAPVRRKLAAQSPASRCATCAKSNADIMREQANAVLAAAQGEKGAEKAVQETVPEELRLAYREDLGEGQSKKLGNSEAENAAAENHRATAATTTTITKTPAVAGTPSSGLAPAPPATATAAQTTHRQQQPQQTVIQQDGEPAAWIDKAIYGIISMLVFLIWKKYLL